MPQVNEEELRSDAITDLELWRCDQCGQCTSVCPSRKNGGIRTRDVMERAANGTFDASLDEQIWRCLMCNSCSERCELDADPAEVITLLRNIAAERGNVPEHFKEEARLFLATGLSFPSTGMTKKIRREMGLPDLVVKEETIADVRRIVAGTRLGRVKLE